MKQNVIYYPAGCYGTFVEWIFNYAEKAVDLTQLPFTVLGDSHHFCGNFLLDCQISGYLAQSDRQKKFIRIHPGTYLNESYISMYDTICGNIDFLHEANSKILFLHSTNKSMIWWLNNELKINITPEIYDYLLAINSNLADIYPIDIINATPRKKIETLLSKELSKDAFLQWGKSVDQFEIWELRELMAFYYFNRRLLTDNDIVKLKNKYQLDILFVSLDSLSNEFCFCIQKMLDYFDLPSISIEKLSDIELQWKQRQHHLNKDALCQQIVTNVVTDTYFEWDASTLSLIDEAWIQKKLLDSNIELKCYQLNQFPANTLELKKYMVYI